jgi:4-oxalocrotonate tautomerase
MPLIEVHVIENVFNPEQKSQMIRKLTDAMVSIEGENMRGVTWVKISEVASGDWGVGGQSVTTEAEGSRGRPKGGLTRRRPCIVGRLVLPAVLRGASSF